MQRMFGNTAICGFDQLLVDTLLPITAISAIAFCVYYRNTILSKSVYLIPWLIYLTTQKNSGLFFAFFIIALVVILAKQRKNGMITLASKKWGIIATITAVPLTTLLLWQKHIAYVIPNGLESKHAMSMTNYIQIFNGKTRKLFEVLLRISPARYFLGRTNSASYLCSVLFCYVYLDCYPRIALIRVLFWFMASPVI